MAPKALMLCRAAKIVEPMRVARALILNAEQKAALEVHARARGAPARSVERARIVLLAARGMQNRKIAARLRIQPKEAAR